MLRWSCVVLMLAVASLAAAEEIPGVGKIGEVQRLHTGLAFTEGPTQDSDGNLFFTDIPANRIHKRDSKGTLTTFVHPSGHCNGLMAIGDRLYACAMDGQLKYFDLRTGKDTVLASEFEGTRFNAPNDLVMDRQGGIYFTDPRFRAPDPWPQGMEAVYYRDSEGNLTRLIKNRIAPNGVILSPDEDVLYVVPSMEKQMWAYPVISPGQLREGKVLCEVTQKEGVDNSGGDGLTIDTNGNLYITTALGVQIFNPDGKQLGIIEFPEQPANVTFGGKNNQTLFVTARTSIYSVETEATGHRFPGNE